MALVELLLSPLPAHVRTARLVIVTAARRAGLEDGLVDEFRFAVGEAASRAVGLNQRHAPGDAVRITVEDGQGGLTVTVTDRGPAAGPAPDDVAAEILQGGDLDEEPPLAPDVALALISGLVDTTTVEVGPDGTTVTLRWPLPTAGRGPGSTAVTSP